MWFDPDLRGGGTTVRLLNLTKIISIVIMKLKGPISSSFMVSISDVQRRIILDVLVQINMPISECHNNYLSVRTSKQTYDSRPNMSTPRIDHDIASTLSSNI